WATSPIDLGKAPPSHSLPRSSTHTERPDCARRQAETAPPKPDPITATSYCLAISLVSIVLLALFPDPDEKARKQDREYQIPDDRYEEENRYLALVDQHVDNEVGSKGHLSDHSQQDDIPVQVHVSIRKVVADPEDREQRNP